MARMASFEEAASKSKAAWQDWPASETEREVRPFAKEPDTEPSVYSAVPPPLSRTESTKIDRVAYLEARLEALESFVAGEGAAFIDLHREKTKHIEKLEARIEILDIGFAALKNRIEHLDRNLHELYGCLYRLGGVRRGPEEQDVDRARRLYESLTAVVRSPMNANCPLVDPEREGP
jgi:hypothetical protein